MHQLRLARFDEIYRIKLLFVDFIRIEKNVLHSLYHHIQFFRDNRLMQKPPRREDFLFFAQKLNTCPHGKQ